jgi:KUP system potassium uptake protein
VAVPRPINSSANAVVVAHNEDCLFVSNPADSPAQHSSTPTRTDRRRLLPLTLTALGVVYGDIGTSPLYALRECFFGSHSVPPTHDNVLGVLSLIIYSLVLVISIKYVLIVMRADNQGEGGVLALTALIPGRAGVAGGPARLAVGRPVLIALGIFGTALLYGDGMITPAISVLGAVEGLEVITPLFRPYVVPVTLVILVGLFAIQKYGTHRVGRMFGPIMVTWFVTIAALGVAWITRAPAVLMALDPRHAVAFFAANGFTGFAVLGAVFLVVTGGEALYADMGHFGKEPIRLAWFAFVLPALLLNYLGQGALLLIDPAVEHPFFLLAPSWAMLPLVALATSAAIIASQALISGSFSITRQAIQLGLAPRLDVEHTSAREMGQIYVPQVNWALMGATLLIVIGFGSSSAVAAAYGIAVTLTMVITVLLLYIVMTERWRWPKPAAVALTMLFLGIDFAFFGANALKLMQGGWVTLAVALLLFTLMTTWKTGRRLVAERLTERAVPLEQFIAMVAAIQPLRVPGTAVFMTAQPTGTPPALAHNLRCNKVLHSHVFILSVTTAQRPHVADADRTVIELLGHQMFNVRVQYGFMDDPDVPSALLQASEQGLPLDPDDVTYFLGRETIIVARRKGMAIWREKLFVLMSRNAIRATAFFRLPPERVVELGVQVEM